MAAVRKGEEPRADGARRLQVDERRSQLIALGIELFSQRSPDEISIDEIAEAAGISKGLLYHYFGSKRAFYLASIRAAAEELLSHTQAQVATEQPSLPELVAPTGPGGALDPEALRRAAIEAGRRRLRTGLDAYLAHVEARAEGYAILVTSGTADPEVREIVEASRQAFAAQILADLGLVEPPGLLRAGLRGWIAFVETSSLDWLEHRDLTRAELRDLLAEVLLATLRAAGLEGVDP